MSFIALLLPHPPLCCSHSPVGAGLWHSRCLCDGSAKGRLVPGWCACARAAALTQRLTGRQTDRQTDRQADRQDRHAQRTHIHFLTHFAPCLDPACQHGACVCHWLPLRRPTPPLCPLPRLQQLPLQNIFFDGQAVRTADATAPIVRIVEDVVRVALLCMHACMHACIRARACVCWSALFISCDIICFMPGPSLFIAPTNKQTNNSCCCCCYCCLCVCSAVQGRELELRRPLTARRGIIARPRLHSAHGG